MCVIGCGGIATSHHGPAYARYAAHQPDAGLCACCDLDGQKAADYARRFGFRRPYTDYLEMLAAEKPNAVCLNVPPQHTASLACRILHMGYPLLMEKPPGLTVSETDAMIRAAEESGTPHQVAFNRRATPLVRALKGILTRIDRDSLLSQVDRDGLPARIDRDGVLAGAGLPTTRDSTLSQVDRDGLPARIDRDGVLAGAGLPTRAVLAPIQHIQYEFYRVGRTDPDFTTTAIHGIDAVRFLAGCDYAQIAFHYQEIPFHASPVTNFFLHCTLASGGTAHLSFLPASGAVLERATLHLQDHLFFLRLPVWNGLDTPGSLQWISQGQLVRQWSGPELSASNDDYALNGFWDEDASFFDDIRLGRRPACDLYRARQSVEVAQAMRERRKEYSIH